MPLVKVGLNEAHLASLDKAGKILGHKSRSETLRWLALSAARFAEEERLTGYGEIEQGHRRQLKGDDQ